MPGVAVLGTGIMGAPMAANLAKAGFPTTVWKRTADKAARLAAEDGVRAAGTVANAVAGARFIVTMVKDADAVEELLTAPSVEFEPDAILVQASTVGVEGALRLAQIASWAGLRVVDAPVLGTKGPAHAGQLVVLASGDPALRSDVAPVLDAVAKTTLWISETPGDASKVKVAVNAFIGAVTHGLAESVRLAEGMGIDPDWVRAALARGPLDSPFVKMKLEAILEQTFDPAFTVDNAAKDSRLVLDAATATGVWAPLAEAGLARYDAASRAGHGDRDMAASYYADTSAINTVTDGTSHAVAGHLAPTVTSRRATTADERTEPLRADQAREQRNRR